MNERNYQVEQIDEKGNFITAISGLGQNQGTWDKCHSKRTAQRYAKQMRELEPQNRFRVEHYLGPEHE